MNEVRSAHAYADELSRMDAVATAEAIRAGRVGAAEVVEAAIRRAEAVNPALNAVVVTDYERAMERAKSAPAGAFAGVPTFLKDMIDLAGLPTRWGSDTLRNVGPARKTGGIARQMEDMGLVFLGKTTMPEWGLTPSAEYPVDPPTRNPWNLDHSAGGSSSGAGALVAAGVVPIAHGCDGGGSVRFPAACCGLVGLKSSRGRLLPHPEEKMLPIRLVVDGVETRTVRDTALFFAEAEKRYKDPGLPRMNLVVTPPARRLRIGAALHSPVGAPYDQCMQDTFHATVKLLEELGHHVEPVEHPLADELVEDLVRYFSMLAFALVKTGRIQFGSAFDKTRLTDYNRGFADSFKKNMHKLPGSLLRIRRAVRQYRAMFSEVDVILSPAGTTVAPPIGHLGTHLPFETLLPRVAEWIGLAPIANTAGTPSISLPMGFDEEKHLPAGMLFDADYGQDALLLELALELEQARPWRTLAD